MDISTAKLALAAAGGAASGGSVYVDDVFSTYLYDGNSSDQTIVNGIDLAGEGGLVIQRRTNVAGYWFLNDTENGADNFLFTNFTNGLGVSTSGSSFNSNGFTIGTENNLHASGNEVASWTFRKAPGFFDVVNYTGDGVRNRAVPHSLGSVPGMIIVKQTSTNGQDWHVWHRSMNPAWTGGTTAGNTDGGNNTGSIELNLTNAYSSSRGVFTYVNDTAFGVYKSNLELNSSGSTYVAYIFAHDDQRFGTTSAESIIKCGSYVGNGSANGPTIDLGWEPQFLFIKCSSRPGSSYGGGGLVLDTMRGIPTTSSGLKCIQFDESNSETNDNNIRLNLTSTGFKLTSSDIFGNLNGGTYIYMAIRRPNKPPEVATEVFSVTTTTNDNNFNTTGFPVDLAIAGNTDATYGNGISSRLQGQNLMFTNKDNGEILTLTADTWTSNTSFRFAYAGNGYNYVNYAFKRAPGFMDVVTYTGAVTSSQNPQTVSHNLGVTPELMLVKRRSGGANWYVYSNALTYPLTQRLDLNNNSVMSSTSDAWGATGSPTAPTANSFTVGIATETGWAAPSDFVAYLFATLPGISKVGAYTGTGYAINVDCGFAYGARFVLIKRTDGNADWYLYDNVRGISTGNDPYIVMNNHVPQVTNTDYIDPLSTGFTITSSAPTDLNTNGGTYIFLAIA